MLFNYAESPTYNCGRIILAVLSFPRVKAGLPKQLNLENVNDNPRNIQTKAVYLGFL